jgi:glycosyltransferase involved in cell wall biosynthesis
MSDRGAASSRRPLRIRWATWWPIPYWTDRFNVLAAHPDVDLEVVFLHEAASMYSFDLDTRRWNFRYRVLSKGHGSPGFYHPSLKLRDPRPLVAGPASTWLVMPYADATFLAAATLARLRRMRYALFVANTSVDLRSGSVFFEMAKRWAVNNATACLATGPLQVDYVHRYAPKIPVTLIGNPVDISRLDRAASLAARPSTRSHYRWGRRVVLGYVGRLAPEKDLVSLLRAASLLGKAGHDITVALAGTGPGEGALRRLAQELGVDARVLGFLDGAELGRFYGAIDVFVLPSVSEPWGLVVNEAMAMSLPVVASDRVGSRHLLGSGGGVVFRAGDVDDLVKRLGPLVRSPEERERVGHAAAEYIRTQTVGAWTTAVVAGLSQHSRI